MGRIILFFGLYAVIAYTGGFAWWQIHQQPHIRVADLSNAAQSLFSPLYARDNNRFYRWRTADGTWRYGAERPARQDLTTTEDTTRMVENRETLLHAVTKRFPELDYAANRKKGIDDAVNSAL